MYRTIKALIADCSGAAITEFALLAPVFFLFLFGTVEGSRLMWMQQTLEEVAYSTARCASVQAECNTEALQKGHAVDRANAYGVLVTAAQVTVQGNVNCRGFPNSNRVAITRNFESVVSGMVPSFPSTIAAESCFPVVTGSPML